MTARIRSARIRLGLARHAHGFRLVNNNTSGEDSWCVHYGASHPVALPFGTDWETANFVAHAPADITYLLNLVEQQAAALTAVETATRKNATKDGRELAALIRATIKERAPK